MRLICRYPPVAAALAACLVAGCAVGPDFKPPPAPAEHAYATPGGPRPTASAPGPNGHAQVFKRAAKVRGDWYRLFGSDALNRLITKALANSPSLAAGRARLAAAREQVAVQRGGNTPQLDANGEVSRNRFTGTQFGISDPQFSNRFTLYRGQLTLGYDVDVFGKRRRQIENSQARFDFRHYQLLDTTLTLVDNVVATALAQAGLRATLHATGQIIQAQSKALDIIRSQARNGAATKADVARAKALLAATRAGLPPLHKQLRLARNRLALLTGQSPAAFSDPKITLQQLHLPRKLPVSLPSQLVAQRPDILAARSLMHAASAKIGIVTAERLPDFSLNASASRAATAVDALTDPAALLYSFGASFAAPLFHGGALGAQKRAAQDQYRAAAADYQAAVLKAFGQVADSLAALGADANGLAARQTALAAARDNRDVVANQVRAGATDYLSLYTAETQFQQALMDWVRARIQRFGDTATLFRALGGGWWQHDSKQPSAVAAAARPATATDPQPEAR